ncbi:MAG: NFACT RNA binding domain-containing protein [Candidatus Pacearchaeota archaeon]
MVNKKIPKSISKEEIKNAVLDSRDKSKTKDSYKKFRWFFTSSKKLVIGGKNAEQNEEIIRQIEKDEEVFHSAKPGSPFVNIKGKANDTDIKQAATFCALKSHDWRDNQGDVEIHRFNGRDIFKTKGMKMGTFGVRNHKSIVIKKQDILKLKEKLEKEAGN